MLFGCKENAKATNNGVPTIKNSKETGKIASVNWSGKWIYSKKNKDSDIPEQQFTLTIFQEGDNIKAQYCAIANSGGKIDCENEKEYNLIGKVEKGKIVGQFYSFFGSSKDKGQFEITMVDENTISWKVITAPQGIFYAPDNCLLKKEISNEVSQNRGNEENSSHSLLPIDSKDLDKNQNLVFDDQSADWLKQSFYQNYDLAVDGSIRLFSQNNFDFYLIKNVGGDSELIYLVSTKNNKIVDGISVADSNGDNDMVKTFSIDEQNNVMLYNEINNKRKLTAKYSCNRNGRFIKE